MANYIRSSSSKVARLTANADGAVIIINTEKTDLCEPDTTESPTKYITNNKAAAYYVN
jgi:hypothetical protein